MTKSQLKTNTPKIDTTPIDTAKDRDLSKAIPKVGRDDHTKRIAEIRARRAERGTIDGPAMRLSVPEERKDPNWDYRWVNDSDMRIHNMMERDWDFAESELDVNATTDKGMGTRVERTVNERSMKGQPQKGFLMKKPKEIYDEDQANKEAKRRKLEQSMEKGKAQSAEGLQGPNAYVVPGTKLT